MLLTMMGEVWDRRQEGRKQLQKDGLTVKTKAGGDRVHPAVKVVEAAEITFAAAAPRARFGHRRAAGNETAAAVAFDAR